MIRSTAENPRARPQRWIALLAASVLLHVIVFNWAEGRLGFPSLQDKSQTEVSAVLLPPPAAPAPPPAAVPKPKAKRKRAPAPKPAPAPAPDTAVQSAPPLQPMTPDAPADGTASATESATDIADTIASASGEAEEQATTRYQVAPPPSAELQYDVQALSKGQNWHGDGVFQWESDGSSYRVSAEASVTIIFKISALNAQSEGAIKDFGLAPVLYSEKKRNKPLTNTHFRHDEKLISFSASETTYPYRGGEQDRISVIWQLAGIGRGDPGQFVPGTGIDIFVAGRRNADTWHIQVIGEEEIDTPYGKLTAWHLVRAPRAGFYDEQLDVWLSPQHEWYPARVRYTYTNGDHIELSLSAIGPAATH